MCPSGQVLGGNLTQQCTGATRQACPGMTDTNHHKGKALNRNGQPPSSHLDDRPTPRPTRKVGTMHTNDAPQTSQGTPERPQDTTRNPGQPPNNWWTKATSAAPLVTVAALISTTLSFQGMLGTATAALGLSLAVGLALAGFLEIATLATGRLLQEAIRDGRRATVERAATWVFSIVSGLFSAAHEFIGPVDATGIHHWETSDPMTWIAGAIRLTAPLVACWLWERRFRGDRATAAGRRTRAATRHDNYVLRVALAAATVRHVSAATPQPTGGKLALVIGWIFAIRRTIATAKLRRHYVAYWRRYPLTNTAHRDALMDGLRAAGLADELPALTTPTPSTVAIAVAPRAKTADSAPSAVALDAERLTVAVAVLQGTPDATADDIAAEFSTRPGWGSSQRTAERWLSNARRHIAATKPDQSLSSDMSPLPGLEYVTVQ